MGSAQAVRAHPPPSPSRSRTLVFSATLATAVGLGTFPTFAFGVLAPLLRDEFGLSRSELGLLTTAIFIVGAPASLAAGRIIDRTPGRTLGMWIFLSFSAAILGIALAPTYPWLLVASALAGIALALGNPGTNKLVAVHIPPGKRGVVMGLKQSGVQISALLAGVILPRAAHLWGWRVAIALAIVPACLGIVGILSFPRDEPRAGSHAGDPTGAGGRALRSLAMYAFLMGAAMTSLIAYLPLYAEERIGLTVAQGGTLAATIGLTGVAARIFWGWRSERVSHMSTPLALMSAGAVLATIAILSAPGAGRWILWPAAVVIGATGAAWMAVGMLAIVTEVQGERMGRASGVVIFWFFSGQMSSPLLFGYVVDSADSYVPGWIGVAVAFGLAGLIASRWRASIRRERAAGG